MLIAAHEFGHSMGFLHETDRLATMNTYYPGAGVLGNNNDPDPHANDVAGDRFLYGSGGTYHDVAASAYYRDSPGGSFAIPAPPLVRRGGYAKLRFTISNRGTEREDYVLVHFYLSRDRWIDTADTYLGAVAYWMDPGFEGTFTVGLQIPPSVAPGYYFIGYLLDPYRFIAETDEDNNGVAYMDWTGIY